MLMKATRRQSVAKMRKRRLVFVVVDDLDREVVDVVEFMD